MYDLENIHKYANQFSRVMSLSNEYSRERFDYLSNVANYYLKHFPVEWKQAFKDNNNYYHKIARLKKRIAKIIEFPAVFLTLTFTDDVLNSTTQITRRKYITNFLKSSCVSYVANIDFGAKNGREHYHAVVFAPFLDYKDYHYGAINGERVHCTNSDIRLSKYLSKLARHGVKDTAKGFRIIYSRN